MAELKTAQGLVVGIIPDNLLSTPEKVEEEEKAPKRARKAKVEE